jgi:predicted nucleotide-binding protein
MAHTNVTKPTKVFLVHGRDDGAKETVARFLEQIDLEVVILHEQPNKGRTLMEKFMEEAKDGTAYAVVLMTPDDVGRAVTDPPAKDEHRARQNVVFEFGFFVAHLGSERVCAVLGEGVTKPSDIDGLAYVGYAASSRQWRMDLAKELRSAGVQFNHAKVF